MSLKSWLNELDIATLPWWLLCVLAGLAFLLGAWLT